MIKLEPTQVTFLMEGEDGNRIYVKRDDLIPKYQGGNKVRIALAHREEMKKRGADLMISYGSPSSNLNRVIAMMCREEGIPCRIITSREEKASSLTRNEKLVRESGAELFECGKSGVRETVAAVLKDAREEGFSPYYVYGNEYGQGLEHIPAESYAACFQEILRQQEESGGPFDYLFHASGTGGTQAGLICGRALAHSETEIVGISVAREEERGKSAVEAAVKAFAQRHPEMPEKDAKIIFDTAALQGGYGQAGEEERQLIRRMWEEKKIPLDRTYTGKAFYGMMHYLKRNQIRNSRILFLHTGGTPLFLDEQEENE